MEPSRTIDTYSVLELSQICGAQCICLGHHWDEVNPGAQSFHDFDIEGLEGVACRSDKVKAGMYTKVNFVYPARLLLL